MERKNKARAETGIYLVVVAAILVIANIISFRVYKRFDTTKNERFSLSKGSARLVGRGPQQGPRRHHLRDARPPQARGVHHRISPT